MKGDFSNWRFNPLANDQGLLFQQGRVTLDSDLTEAGLIDLVWRTQAGRDIIGANLAAVPADAPQGWRVSAARVQGDTVRVTLQPGRIWADGQLLYLPGDGAVERIATYLPPPANPAGTGVAGIGAGTRDAVILEFTLEELNGFQAPDRLIEPALGGPDTAERITVRTALRLVRLDRDETCAGLAGRLGDAPGGRLTATLTPPDDGDGPCPQASLGGYTGFEHNLYRIEIAEADSGGPWFKWSRFNGALVGRGEFLISGSLRRVVLGANRAAIVNSGLTGFYLEALGYDPDLGHWRVVYGTQATLNGDQDLELAHPPVYGTFPSTAAGETLFFRLWDGLAAVSAFTDEADPAHLNDGIHLAFDAPATATYRPGDYWTFALRAGDIGNRPTLVNQRHPDGPLIRRVALAEIDWNAALDVSATEGGIEDCRRRFNPLTRQKTCCTLMVGDGLTSFGDFNSLEEAAAHLPAVGGELCLLPGIHFANLALSQRRNIRIRGCPHRTWVIARPTTPAHPVLAFTDCSDIHVAGLDIVSFAGAGIVAEADAKSRSREFSVKECRILAHTECIRAHGLNDVHLAENRVWLMDTAHGRAAISLRVREGLAERNHVGVWPWSEQPPGDDGTDRPDPDDPCAEPERLYGQLTRVLDYVRRLWHAPRNALPKQPYLAWGGIHLRAGCEEVRLLENHIDGGAGHGITLGGVLPADLAEANRDGAGISPAITPDPKARQIVGYSLDEQGRAIADVDIYLARDSMPVAHATSGADGAFQFSGLPATRHDVSVEAGLEIAEMRQGQINLGAMALTYHILVLRTRSVAEVDEGAGLHRIAIDGNEVERMGLSGIGFLPHTLARNPPDLPDSFSSLDDQVAWLSYLIAPRDLIATCNVLTDLQIRGNRLHHNLLAVFGDLLRRAARSIGQGGISLALVESGVIADNLIHENGTRAVNPTCGIFAGYVEDLEIRGNRISGNGPLDDDYSADRLQGLRGGVYIRLAGAFLIGGGADAFQKPALRLADNVIDQPAGRALTAFAFGPVACDSNRFNSEREGRLGFLEGMVGTVLILNLGGIHRQLNFPATQDAQAEADTDVAGSPSHLTGYVTNAYADVARAESLLPGGETLFNNNQSRMGPDNRAFLAQCLLTLDDLGYDGNQSAVFRQDFVFANVAAFALSVRATGNRFRERVQCCGMSLWTQAYGITLAARDLAMNTTTTNQADHCILALSNGTLPVVDPANLVLTQRACAHVSNDRLVCPTEKKSAIAYIRQVLLLTLFAENSGALAQAGQATSGKQVVASGMEAMTQLNYAYRQRTQQEAVRMQATYGTEATRTQAMAIRLKRNGDTLDQLKLHGQLSRVEDIAPEAGGAVFSGRVNSSDGSGQAGLSVELTRADGSSLDLRATTDAMGHYAFVLDAATAKRLSAEKQGVHVKFSDAVGQVLSREKAPQGIVAGRTVRIQTTVAAPIVPASALTLGSVVYRAPVAGSMDPIKSTPLENVKGIGPKTAARYRAAGIADMETLTRAPASKLAEAAGLDKRVVEAETHRTTADVPRRKRVKSGENTQDDAVGRGKAGAAGTGRTGVGKGKKPTK